MLQTLFDLLGELPGLISDRVHLLALEAQRAAQSLARMMVLAVAAALMLSTAWLALWAGLAWAAIQAGMPWFVALLLVIVINSGAAILALRRALGMAHLVALPATVRHMTLESPDHPAQEDEDHAVTPAVS
jgi:hypothetical protein